MSHGCPCLLVMIGKVMILGGWWTGCREVGAIVWVAGGSGSYGRGMSSTSAKVAARERARLARGRRQEAVRERENRIGRLAELFYQHEELRRRHELASAAPVAELLALGESVGAVASLLGVGVGRVRALKALAGDTAVNGTDSVHTGHRAAERPVPAGGAGPRGWPRAEEGTVPGP